MKKIALESLSMSANDLERLARRETIILTRRGKPAASVKNIAGADWESLALAANPEFVRIVEEARRSIQKEGGVAIEEVSRQLNLRCPPQNDASGSRSAKKRPPSNGRSSHGRDTK